MIYSVTRMLTTELINAGYSKEYIYFTVLDTFFTSTNPVICSQDTIVDFFNHFTFQKYDYQATFLHWINWSMHNISAIKDIAHFFRNNSL